MEPILLYGHPQGSSAGLIAAFEWLGQPYRLSRVTMPDDMANERYDRLNPRRETPVLIIDDGRVVSETLAIAAWLEQRDVERRISFDPGTPEGDRLHQLCAFINSSFTNGFAPLWIAEEVPGLDDDFRAAIKRLGAMITTKRHQQLETLVGDTPFLLGERPTLADALLLGVGRWIEYLKAGDPADYPRSHALRQRIEATPAARFALAIEAGETPPGSGACRGQVALEEVIDRFGH